MAPFVKVQIALQVSYRLQKAAIDTVIHFLVIVIYYIFEQLQYDDYYLYQIIAKFGTLFIVHSTVHTLNSLPCVAYDMFPIPVAILAANDIFYRNAKHFSTTASSLQIQTAHLNQ